MSKTGWTVGALVVALGAGGAYYYSHLKADVPKYRTAAADRGTVTATVTATGTLSAVTTVAIGSQVSGIISKLYVDFNSKVKKGQLLAELDPTPFQEAVNQQLANLEKAKADLHLAEITLARQKNLRDLQLIAASDYDTAVGARDDAAAAVKQNEATLQQAQTNMTYTKITAPIDGVVVDREYNVGQTVAASFQAPLIFSIAQDLTKMQVLTNIDEADVGGIKVGQSANFNVDAYADRTFHGTVAQIRLSTTTVQNVVTYPVMIDVPNQDGKLLPGMTANVQIPVDTRRDMLRVPNSALRFKPDTADVLHAPGEPQGGAAAGAADGGAAGGSSSGTAGSGGAGAGAGAGGSGATTASGAAAAGTGSSGNPAGTAGTAGLSDQSPAGGRRGGGVGAGVGGGATAGGSASGSGPSGRRQAAGAHPAVVYVEVPGTHKLRAVRVITLLTDGVFTAVSSQQLHAGDPVVVGLQTAKVNVSGSRPPRM